MIKAKRKLFEAISVDPVTRKATEHYLFLAYDHEDATHEYFNRPRALILTDVEVHIREFSPVTNPLYQRDVSQHSDDESDQETV